MTSELLIATALSFLPSFCNAEIRTVPSFGDDTMAVYDYDRDEIILSEELLYREIEWTITHEAFHCAEDQHDIRIPPMFGRAPFVTEYASNDRWEDFAETATAQYLGNRVPGRKGMYVRRLLRRLDSEVVKK